MTVEQRKEKALFHKELVDVLTKCPSDTEYLQRLVWGLEIISNALSSFAPDLIVKESEEEEEE